MTAKEGIDALLQGVGCDADFEGRLIKGLSKILEDAFPLGRTGTVVFNRWAVSTPSGRVAAFADRNGEFRSNVWLNRFPADRGDYLTERVWARNGNGQEVWIVTIAGDAGSWVPSCSCGRVAGNHCHITLPEGFWRLLGAEGKLHKALDKEIRRHGFRKSDNMSEAERAIKVARGMRVPREKDPFEACRTRCLADAADYWSRPSNAAGLNAVFEALFGDEIREEVERQGRGQGSPFSNPPAQVPDLARRFLHMWQTVAAFRSDLGEMRMFVGRAAETDPGTRRPHVAVTLFAFNGHNPLSADHSETAREVIAWIEAGRPSDSGSGATVDGPVSCPWQRALDAYLENSIRIDRPAGIEEPMCLAARLSRSAHEGHPSHFAFLVGNDNAWPVLGEVLSGDLGDLPQIKLDILVRAVEANYSLFQLPGAIGFWNTVARAAHSRLARAGDGAPYLSIRRLALGARACGNAVDRDAMYLAVMDRLGDHYHRAQPGGSPPWLLATRGDGTVQVYWFDAAQRGALGLVWNVADGRIEPGNLMTGRPEEQFLTSQKLAGLLDTIQKISRTRGHGATLIIAEECVKDDYLRSLEPYAPEWQRELFLDEVPEDLLRAAVVMDGGTFLSLAKDQHGGKVKITPRLMTVPIAEGVAFNLMEYLKGCRGTSAAEAEAEILHLIGKGARTHGAAALCHLLKSKGMTANSNFCVITVSADGPINSWRPT